MPRSTMSSAASAGSVPMLNANAMSARIVVLPILLSDCRRSRAGAPPRARAHGDANENRAQRDLRPAINRASLVRQRIGPQLEVRRERLGSLAAFDQPRRAVAIGGPQSPALPAGVRIVDP